MKVSRRDMPSFTIVPGINPPLCSTCPGRSITSRERLPGSGINGVIGDTRRWMINKPASAIQGRIILGRVSRWERFLHFFVPFPPTERLTGSKKAH